VARTTTAVTRVEILKSAATAFRRYGYHGATVEKIAAALRMKKGNLYYHFKNKEEILFACHQYSLDQLLALLEEVEGAQSQPTPSWPTSSWRSCTPSSTSSRGRLVPGSRGAVALAPAGRHRAARPDRPGDAPRRQRGRASGAFGPIDAKLLSFAILGAVNWIPRWFRPDGSASSQEIADQFAAYLIAGLRSAGTARLEPI